MTMRRVVAIAMSGVSALSCRTPSTVGTGASVSPAGASSDRTIQYVWADAAPRTDWPAPAPGKSHTLMPTPKTVAWGWYDATGEPVLRVGSGDEVTVRALSTCSPQSLVRAGLDSNRVEQLAKDIYAARQTMKTGPGGHILTGPIYVE